MEQADWIMASEIRSVAEAMCVALARVGQKVKSGEIEAGSQAEILAWALSMGRTDWGECGENAFCHTSGGKFSIAPDDDIKTLTLKIVLAEQGKDDLLAEGFTEEKIAKIIDDEVKVYMRR